MNRKRKIARNLVLVGCFWLLLWCGTGRQLYWTPEAVLRGSERSLHYGPSEIVYREEDTERAYLLARYENYYSCNSIRRAGPLWRLDSSFHVGTEMDASLPLNWTWGMSYSRYLVYGIVNDPRIASVEVKTGSGQTLRQDRLHDGMFLFRWVDEEQRNLKWLRAYDAAGALLYEGEHPTG